MQLSVIMGRQQKDIDLKAWKEDIQYSENVYKHISDVTSL